MGGFTRNPQRPLDKTGGHSAPTRGATPRTAPSPVLAFSSLVQLNCIYFIFCSHPPPPRHIDTIPPFSNPPLLSVFALAVPGLQREPPAAPAATETCVPCSAACSPRLRLFSWLSFLLTPPSPPRPPRRAPASKRGQPRNQRRRLQEGQLETALKRLNFFPQIYTGIKLDTPSSLSKPTPLLFLKVAKRK